MDREQPEYLAKLPKDRKGIAWTVALGVLLAFTLAAAWKLHMETTQAWETRYGEQPNPPKAPAPVKATRVEAQLAEQRLRDLTAAREDSRVSVREGAPPFDKCINGTAFKQLPNGGWANVPGIKCQVKNRQ